MANRSYVAYRMDRRNIIGLAVGAVVVAVALAIAVNVAINPWTLQWARTGAWLVAGTAAVVGLGLAVWQGVWHRSDVRRRAENGVTAVRETLLEDVLAAERPDPSSPRLVVRSADDLVVPPGFQLHSPRPLPGAFGSVTDVEAWFTRAVGSLLVLGEAGSGKTNLLARLAVEAAELARQEPERPVPVALNLASWGIGGRTLQSWVGEELRRRYAVGPASALEILRPGRSYLLLDGLDELKPRDREGCVREINSFVERQPTTRMVVASRPRTYLELPVRLQFTSAVMLTLPAPDDGGLLSLGEDGDIDALVEEEKKPATGDFPPIGGLPAGGAAPAEEPAHVGGGRAPSDPASRPADPSGAPPPAVRRGAQPRPPGPPQPAPDPEHDASDTRLVVLEQAVLSVLDPQVGQDELQIASAAKITPGETARTLQRLEERGLVVPATPRQTGARIVRRYVKR